MQHLHYIHSKNLGIFVNLLLLWDLRILPILLRWISTVSLLDHWFKIIGQICPFLGLVFVHEDSLEGTLKNFTLSFPEQVTFLAGETYQKLCVFACPGTQYHWTGVHNGIPDVVCLQDLVVLPWCKRSVFYVELSKRYLSPSSASTHRFSLSVGTNTWVVNSDQEILTKGQLGHHAVTCLTWHRWLLHPVHLEPSTEIVFYLQVLLNFHVGTSLVTHDSFGPPKGQTKQKKA